MSESEFTGERVIPDAVDPDLLNEHLARYRFASRFCKGAAVLDAGCGVGYGAAELAGAASVTGVDISADALAYARERYARPGVRFVRAGCEALPFAEASFDLIAAFEVIEHLERWPDLLREARRVLKPSGTLLVSTPNKAYYNEMRAGAGPNPFHSHEFEHEEFRSALEAVFPQVRIWAQNRAEAMVLAPANPGRSVLDATGDAAPEDAHFFLAACSASPVAADEVFAWLPATGNLLRERERHIEKLRDELSQKDTWLEDLKGKHASLQASHEAALADLRQRAIWAEQLTSLVQDRDRMILQLQAEADERLGWVRSLQSELAGAGDEVERLHAVESRLESDLAARTGWARGLEAELAECGEHVRLQALKLAELRAGLDEFQQREALIAQSKWMRLGRSLHLGPVITVPGADHP